MSSFWAYDGWEGSMKEQLIDNPMPRQRTVDPAIPQRHMPYNLDQPSGILRVLRQEHKFRMNPIQVLTAAHTLASVLQADRNNGTNGYMVRSLYFDTLNNYDFRTKVNGLDCRRKIRLRIYNTANATAKLEMKQKQSHFQLKRSISIRREDAIALTKGHYDVLLRYDDPFAMECYGLMSTRYYVPKAIVEYNRKAFVVPTNDIRITFDSRIVATESAFDLFDEKLCQTPVGHVNDTILEVKYNGFLFSYIKDMLRRVDKSPLAASKYCMARSVTLGVHE